MNLSAAADASSQADAIAARPGDDLWTVAVEPRHSEERVAETLLTVGDGSFGTRGSVEEMRPDSEPMVLAAGVYDGPLPRLLEGPRWTHLDLAVPVRADRRLLDLRNGVVVREGVLRDGRRLRTLRFASMARPGIMVLWAEGPAGCLHAGAALCPPSGRGLVPVPVDDATAMQVPSGLSGGIAACARQQQHDDDRTVIARVAGFAADPWTTPSVAAARRTLGGTHPAALASLLAEHSTAWDRLWSSADVVVDGDPVVQKGVRLGLFHLLTSVSATGEAAVGARGLSGHAYAGHVFWDADVFVLPVMAAIRPSAARAMLSYRIARLPAARRRAAACGLRGARFPWESALDGSEVTPRHVTTITGQQIPIATRDHAEHIVADVAWAAWQYAEWTGDHAFLTGPGAGLLTDTAAYWASRAQHDADGRAHLEDVVGPDEYHPHVDDNAFTNRVAAWNLRCAGELDRSSAATWRTLAARLVDGYDPRTGRHEQFAGFRHLEPIIISELLSPPVAADLVLGTERTASTQVVKQADVLMLHHMLPDDMPPGSLERDIAYYGPRTAHGSSLSPAVHAGLLARAGRPEEGLALLRLACRLDLDDITGTTAGGLHTANYGGIWQAIVTGFLGVRPRQGALHVDPHLPDSWHRVVASVRFQSELVTVEAGRDRVEVSATGPVTVRWADGSRQRTTSTGRRLDELPRR